MLAMINTLVIAVVALLTVAHITAAPEDYATNIEPNPVAKDFSGATATSTEVTVTCFAGDSLVTLSNGQRKQIGHLQSGDEVLAVDDDSSKKIVNTQMMMMMDKNAFDKAQFYTITTASGHGLSITALHLIPIVSTNGTLNYLPANQVQLGDILYVFSTNELKPSPVINITIESKTGYFAPLTLKGTLLVNDILVSCFASVKSHEWAQLFLTPLRLYYQLARFASLSEPFSSNAADGMHWTVRRMYEFVSYIRPDTLRFS